MDYKNCRQLLTDKIIVAEENKRKFIVSNPQRKTVYRIKVDGCLIMEGVKCDYLFEVDNPISNVFYVELKGKDINHAFKQIEATVKFCKEAHQSKLIRKECHIVTSSSPNLLTTESLNLKVMLKKQYGVTSVNHTNQGNVIV